MKYLLLVLLSFNAYADQYLIDEMEALKASLEKSDPGRQELTLRLADLYFDVSIQEGEEVETRLRMEQRKKALSLYQDVLLGRDGIKKVAPSRVILIQYQMARVYRKLSQMSQAKKYFQIVFNSDLADKNLKREAAFSIAEYYEEEAQFEMADQFYVSAIDLCNTKESCNLSHYKRAWLLYKELKIDAAIGELKRALFDRKNQVREKIINDLMLFFSNRTTDGTDEIAFIQELVQKTGKNELVRQLVEAFYSAGNRVAGANALVYLNKKSPDIFYEMRLLEEYYGFRDWDQIEIYLSSIEKRDRSQLPHKKEEAKEFQEMLKRVIVQFGSEADEDPKQYASFLRRAIDSYLGFYPADDMRTKMQQGWLKAQPDDEAKIVRLKNWIVEDIALGKSNEDVRKLRQTRLALAQKLKLQPVILEESLEMGVLLANKNEAREFNYVAGLHYYKNKNFQFALDKFLPLAHIGDLNKADKWAILSQNLILDIYNQQKEYTKLTAQADTWLTLDKADADKKMLEELASMERVKTQAQFEYYAGLGKDKKALEEFYSFCFANVYADKSCKNAKVLAIELNDQLKTVALLEREKDEKALMVEYERMGQFSKAAKLQEKFNLNRKSPLTEYFKVAALYELDQNFKERDRVLKQALKTFKKTLDLKMETALFVTLDEAGLINEKSLKYPWSLDRKILLANRFADNTASKRFVSSQEGYAGVLWSKTVLKDVEKRFNKVNAYQFYGRNSERKFKRKVKLLEGFVAHSKKYLEPADAETRVYILDMLKRAYLNLGTQILSTPIPEGLTQEILMQVQANLTQLATPYLKVADDYTKLQDEQVVQLEQAEQASMKARLEETIEGYAALIKSNEVKVNLTASYQYDEYLKVKKQMETKPDDIATLTALQKFYLDNDNKRLAGYYSGRINQLKGKL